MTPSTSPAATLPETGASPREICGGGVQPRNIPILQGLPSATLEQVERSLISRRFAKGDYVVHKGGPGDALLFLLTGRLQVVDMTVEGKEIGLSFINPGDYFGELSIIDDQPRSASVIATETSLVALLPRTQAQALIYKNPTVAEKILRRMASGLRNASNYRAILGIPNAFQRVYALLVQFSVTAPGGLVVIENLPRQQEIAIMVNTSRETVSRALHELIQRGVVEKDLRRLIVRKPDALGEIAHVTLGA